MSTDTQIFTSETFDRTCTWYTPLKNSFNQPRRLTGGNAPPSVPFSHTPRWALTNELLQPSALSKSLLDMAEPSLLLLVYTTISTSFCEGDYGRRKRAVFVHRLWFMLLASLRLLP